MKSLRAGTGPMRTLSERESKWEETETPRFLTVVGVVGRVKMEGLSQDSNRVQGYFPFWQLPFTGMTVIVKASGDPNQLIASAREQVKQVDPDQPIYNIKTMDEIRAESVA